MKEILIEKIGASDDSYVVTELSFNNQDYIQVNDVIGAYESSKADLELISETEGYIQYNFNIGDEVIPGDVFATIYKSLEQIQSARTIRKKAEFSGSTLISKKARNLMEEHDLSTNDFDNKEIITEEDVLNFIKNTTKTENSKKLVWEKSAKHNRKEQNVSDLKLKCEEFHFGKNISFGKNIIINCNYLEIHDGVNIGNNVSINGDRIIIGNHSRIGSNVTITNSLYEGSLEVGVGCMIGSNSYLNIEKDILLKDDVCVSSDCKLITHRQWHSPLLGGESVFKQIVLMNSCFIGPGSIIMPGCTIGEYATVIANSSIISDLKSYGLFGGVPAIQIKENCLSKRKLSDPERIDQILNSISKFNLMKGNEEWCMELNCLEKLEFNLKHKEQDYYVKLNTLNTSKSNKYYNIYLNTALDEEEEGISFKDHTLRIHDYNLSTYFYRSFFNCGYHLKILS